MTAPSTKTEYMRGYRARNPEYVRVDRARLNARNDAYRQLASRHWREFDEIYAAELAARGLPPLRRMK